MDHQAKASNASTDSANESSRSKGVKGEEENGMAGAATAVASKRKRNGSKGPDEEGEGYIHIRARKGQATNRHSLAERVHTNCITNYNTIACTRFFRLGVLQTFEERN